MKNILIRLQKYMGKRKSLLPGSILTSAISAVLGVMPYIFIWLIIKQLLIFDAITSKEIITQYAWWALVTAVGSVAFYFLALMLSHLAAFRAETNIRREAMKKLIKLPLGFFDNNPSGKIRKIIDDNASITHSFLAHQLPDLAGTFIVPIITLLLIFVFDWKLGLVCLVPLAITLFIMRNMMAKKGKFFTQKYMRALEDMNTEAVEYVRGIPVVKVFQQTIYSFKNFYKSIMDYKNMVYQYTLLWEKPMSTYTVIINSFAYFLVLAAIFFIASSTNYIEIIVNLILFVLITPVFAESIMRSMHFNHATLQASEAINRVENLTNVETLLVGENPQDITNGEVSFENVSFSYPGVDKKAIDNVSFTIPEGKTFALVGPSGSGKTTTARLAARFWDADEGEVKIGNANVKNITFETLMNNISFVFQSTKLFKTTLLENICYGNSNAGEKEIQNALKLAQCEDIIKKMPDGLDTKIGKKGTYLSGGEMQRISLARAILKNSSIVILDEATAFSDPENEHLIQKAFEKLTENKTVLMIAHRLTSVVNADTILVMNEGKIAERGTHKELIDKNGLYARMWEEYQKSIDWTIN